MPFRVKWTKNKEHDEIQTTFIQLFSLEKNKEKTLKINTAITRSLSRVLNIAKASKPSSAKSNYTCYYKSHIYI